MLAYTVAQQRREIAITVALGASPRNVMSTVLGHGMRLTVFGLLIGGVLALRWDDWCSGNCSASTRRTR